ncbi:MAG: HEAT repeat domain-containing protein [Clostridiales bacterium]|nr:HEAT repeat domain-containing protein [Clostridiales bacterium]
MKRKIIACVLMFAMIASFAACDNKEKETEKETTAKVTTTADEEETTKESKESSAESETSAEATSEETTEATTEATSAAAQGELTKEKYDAMTPEELLAALDIKDPQNLTEDEYFRLLETYRFCDLDYEKMEMASNNSPTKEAIKLVKKLSIDKVMDKLLDSEYPQVRGYGLASLQGLFGVNDNSMAKALAVLETESDDYCLYCATSGLMNEMKNDPKVADFIFKMADHEKARIRVRAAIAIGNSWSRGVDGTVEKITEMMNDPDIDVQKSALANSGKLHDEAVIEPIVAILNDESRAKVHGDAIRGLSWMWLDYPSHESTCEAAYKATLDYYSKTPRTKDVPAWSGISNFNMVSEKNMEESKWRENATYFNADEFTKVMADLIADPDANWLSKEPAMKAVLALCPEKFDSLEEAAKACGDKKVADAFTKLKEKQSQS